MDQPTSRPSPPIATPAALDIPQAVQLLLELAKNGIGVGFAA